MNRKRLFIDGLRMAILSYTNMYFENYELSEILYEMLSDGFYFSYSDIFWRSKEQVIIDLINYGMIENTDSTLLRTLYRKIK